MGLAEYYQGRLFFAQAQYLLMLGLKILPENKKKKMRATLQIALGNLFGHILEHCINQIKKQYKFTGEDN